MIRRYSMEDIPKIVALEEETLGTTLGEKMLLQELSNPMSYYYVFEEDNNIIGYISLSFDGYIGEILNFAVDKSYQNKGIGKKLISYAMDDLYGKHAESFILEVRESNTRAIALYEKLGFKKISIRKNYYNNGENAVVMQKLMVLYKDMNDAYQQTSCTYEYHEHYIRVYDDKHQQKYFHNYYEMKINDYSLMDSLRKGRKGFVQFHLPSPYEGNYPYPDKEKIGYYHVGIYGITPFKGNGNRVEKLTEENRDMFHAFLYLDSLAYGEEYAKENSNREIEVALDKKVMDWYMIYHEDQIVGAISIFRYLDAIKLEDFFVLEEYQRQGYGAQLLNCVIEDYKKQGIHDVHLSADLEDTAKDMYLRMGFTQVGVEYIVREVFA